MCIDWTILCEMLERSNLPTVVANGDDVYENGNFKELSIHPVLKESLILKYSMKCSTGDEDINGYYYGVSTIKYAGITIIEFYPKSPVDKLKKDPEVIKYLTCFFEKLRSEVYDIARKSEALENKLTEYLDKYEDAALTFKYIDNDLNNIMSIMLNPEQIVCLASDRCNEDNINLSRVITELARSFNAYHYGVDVCVDADEICMTKINKYGFEVIVSNFLGRVCNGEYKPDSLYFKIVEVDEIITVQIKADFSSKTPSENNFSNEREFADDFFFQYVLDMYCSRFNAKACMVKNQSFEISFHATPFYELDFHASRRFNPDPDRFAPIVVKTRDKTM